MISVCLASHNGERYIEEQLTSILNQLGPNDEIIVVDDVSSDNTRAIVDELNDPRITLKVNTHRIGHVQSFAAAMGFSSGEYIALADQDDIWTPNRLTAMKRALDETGAQLLAGNFSLIDHSGNPLGLPPRSLKSRESRYCWGNIWGIFLGVRPYYGCAMLMRRDFLKHSLPIPTYVESHDLWLAMAANLQGRICHFPKIVLLKRQHDTNVSAAQRRPLHKVVLSRLVMLLSCAALLWRAVSLKADSAR